MTVYVTLDTLMANWLEDPTAPPYHNLMVDLFLDRHDLGDFIRKVENTFAIELTDDQVESAQTYGDFARLVAEARG